MVSQVEKENNLGSELKIYYSLSLLKKIVTLVKIK